MAADALPRHIRRFTRDDLVAFVASQYTGVNTVVGVTGHIDPDRIVAAAHAAFGGMPRGEANRIAAPAYVGGVCRRACRAEIRCNTATMINSWEVI